MNKNGSNSLNSQHNETANNTTSSPTMSDRIDELTQLQSEHQYWQNKVLEKNLQLLNDTMAFSQKKEEIRQRLDRASNENSDLVNKINELESSIKINQNAKVENDLKFKELKNLVPEIEQENIEIYNEVSSMLI